MSGGVIINLDFTYAVMVLEPVPTSIRLLNSDIPKGNIGLPSTWVVPGKHTPDQTTIDRHGLALYI